jgi:hypothetical protein
LQKDYHHQEGSCEHAVCTEKEGRCPNTFADVVEVEKPQHSNLIGTHEGEKPKGEHEVEHQQAHESPKIPGTDNGAIHHSTSFIMTLNNVQDDIVLGDIQIDDPVLQQMTTTNDVASVTILNEDLDQEEEETDDNFSNVPDTQLAFVKQADVVEVEKRFTPVEIATSVINDCNASSRVIPDTMQKLVILPDEEFDEVVQVELQVIKQVWAAMEKGEKSFTHVISKSQKKKIKQLAQSVG